MMRRFWYRVCFVIARVCLFVSHPVFRVRGKENIPAGRCIYCANHSAALDAIWFLVALNAKDLIRIIAKQELRHAPVIGWIMEKFGIVFVNRGAHDVHAYDACVEALQSGEQLLVVPEGTRCNGEKHVRARTGAIRMAAASGSPLVPVFITRNKKPFRPLDVFFGKPYLLQPDAQQATKEELQHSADELLRIIYRLGGDSYADHIGENGGVLLRG